jgi:hypothetical protein
LCKRGAAPLSNLLPRLEPAGEILLLLKQNVKEREIEGEAGKYARSCKSCGK